MNEIDCAKRSLKVSRTSTWKILNLRTTYLINSTLISRKLNACLLICEITQRSWIVSYRNSKSLLIILKLRENWKCQMANTMTFNNRIILWICIVSLILLSFCLLSLLRIFKLPCEIRFSALTILSINWWWWDERLRLLHQIIKFSRTFPSSFSF